MIVPLHINLGDREIEFKMDLDPETHGSDKAVMWHLQRGVPCEIETTHAMLRILKPGDLAVDAGANIGFFSLLMAKIVGETGEVVAFEPAAVNLERLRANISLNEMTNIRVVAKALYRNTELLSLYGGEDPGEISLTEIGPQFDSVAGTTFDLEFPLEGKQPSFVKMDIEGSEENAIKGGNRMLAQARPPLICELNEEALKRAGSTPDAVRKRMAMYGYQCFLLSESGHLPTMVPTNTEIVVGRLNTNVLFSTLKQLSVSWPKAQA